MSQRRRQRGGRRVQRRRERRKGKSLEVRVGTLNVGTMTGKGRELADAMNRRKLDILCVQETKWKGSKARNIGGGFKLLYHGVDRRRNGVGVILKEEFSERVLEVRRVSDRVVSVKLEIEGVIINVVSAYAPQVGCGREEKESFWKELDEVVETIPRQERVVVGADFNGHVGEGNRGDEAVMGRHGYKERNAEGQSLVDFAVRKDMAVVNTYFKKKEEQRVTFKSGGRCSQVDYILCRRANLKDVSDCKVLVGESIASQHRIVVCRMRLVVKDRKSARLEPRIRWWRLKEKDCQVKFRNEVTQALGGVEEGVNGWTSTATVLKETARRVLGVTSGQRKPDKETWWWNKEVQEGIKEKRVAMKSWQCQGDQVSREAYTEIKCKVKRQVAKAKEKAYDELYAKLSTKEGEKDLYRLARQRDRAAKDIQQVRVIKDADGSVLTGEEKVRGRWKEYFEELLNTENEREREGWTMEGG
ncbi:MAG: endonuclease/exonuclease/phosphatase family protein [Breoghania sp.]|nr:endonuclease/exonuclease/phosphatase family protein [Breoghania sp.]